MITALYAAILAFLYVGLTLNVVTGRWHHKIGLGDKDNPDMQRRVRMHGNFAEYVPFALLLLFFVDYLRFPSILLHVLGIMLVLGRVLHAYGMSKSAGFTAPRGLGVVLTLLVILICAALCLWKFIVIHIIGF